MKDRFLLAAFLAFGFALPGLFGQALTLDNVILKHPHCHGASTGQITAQVSGGTPPYTYVWSYSMIDTTTLDNFLPDRSAGQYGITVTDASNGSTSTVVALINPPKLDITDTTITKIACFGEKSGAITVKAAGGTGNLKYKWSTGDSINSISMLLVGAYKLSVTDANGCLLKETYDVTQPDQLMLSANSTEPTCYKGSNGSIDLMPSGGTKPYGFLWNNGVTTEDLDDIGEGTYSVVVTDENGCQTPGAYTVSQPADLQATLTPINNKCFGDQTGGVGVTDVAGGTPSYSYSWSNGATTQDLQNLAQGPYTLTLTDFNGCTKAFSATVNQPPLLTATCSKTDVSTVGGSDGSVTVAANGGTPPYSFDTPGGSLTGLSSGTYSLKVTDANGCFSVCSATVSPVSCSIVATARVVQNVNCHGGSDGSAEVNVQNSTGSLSYLWSNNATEKTISNLSANEYSVVVTEVSTGCMASSSCTVAQPTAPLSLSFKTVKDTCCRGVGRVELTTLGGTQGMQGYNYNWSNNQTSSTITSLPGGDYAVTVTDANGCTINGTANVQKDSLPTATISGSSFICSDGSSTLSVEKCDQYLWSTGEKTQQITVSQADNYSITVTAANGCTKEGDFLLTVANPLKIEIHGDSILCAGETAMLTAVSVPADPSVKFRWDANGGDLGALLLTDSAGIYTVTATDNDGCQESKTVKVIVNPLPVLTLDKTECNGAKTKYVVFFSCNVSEISAMSSGGAVILTMNLGNGKFKTEEIANGVNINITANSSLNPIFNCKTTIMVKSPDCQCDVPNPTVSSQSEKICQGKPFPTFTATPPPGISTINWYNQQNVVVGTNASFIPPAGGTYTAKSVDQFGCESPGVSVVMIENQNPTVSITPPNEKICFGTALDLTAVGMNGQTPYTYLWDTQATGAFFQVPALPSNPSAPNTRTFSVTVTDGNKCEGTASTTVTVNPVPTVKISGPNEVCKGQPVLDYDVPAVSGVNYQWSVENGILFNTFGNSVKVDWPDGIVGTGKVSVKATIESTGCSSSDNLVITFTNGQAPPEADIFLKTTKDILFCKSPPAEEYCFQWGYGILNKTTQQYAETDLPGETYPQLYLATPYVPTGDPARPDLIYYLEVRKKNAGICDQNGCVSKTYYPAKTVGTNDLSVNQFQCVLFPNPNAGEFSLDFRGPDRPDRLEARVLTLWGSEIERFQLHPNREPSAKISLPTLPSGLYLMYLQSPDGSRQALPFTIHQ